MDWGGRNRWVLVTTVVVVAVLAGSLLVGIQTSQAKRWVFEEDFSVEHLAASETGDYFVTATRPGGTTGPSALHFFRADHIDWNTTTESRITALALSGNGALVAAGLENGGVRLFTGRGEPLASLSTQGPVRDVAVSNDGGLIAVATGTEPRLGERGGLLLYRLGETTPIQHVPRSGASAVALSSDGEMLAATFRGLRNTELVMYDRAHDTTRPALVDSYPGAFRALSMSTDGRHTLLVTDQLALLLARGYERPVGLVPALPDHNTRYIDGVLAANGQSFLLLHADRQTIDLHKWGESDPRWSRTSESDHRGIAIGPGGRAMTAAADGTLTVLSVTTGRPMKEFELLGEPRHLVPSADGRILLASDDQSRLYRAKSGYGGLLGALPDALVSTLYAQPAALLWIGVLGAVAAVAYPVARPVVRRYLAGDDDDDEPDVDLDAIGRVPLPDQTPERLDGRLEVHDLVVQRDDHTILKHVSFRADAGTLTAVVGGSGEGKSTLLNALLGSGVTAGTVRLGSLDPTERSHRLRRLCGFVPQDLQLYPALSPLENLLAFGGQFDLPREHLQRAARRCLGLVGLDADIDRPVSRLSGGQRRRVSIAATLLGGPALLILDEPTTGLDPLTRRQLWRLLGTLRARLGVTIVVSTHYLEEAHAADNVVLLEDGRVLASGPPETVIATAPGGPLLWRFRIRGAVRDVLLAEVVREAAVTAGTHDLLRDITAEGERVTVRLAHPPADAALLVRALRQAGLEPTDTEWIPMRFEDAFIAYLSDARRAAATSKEALQASPDTAHTPTGPTPQPTG